MPEKNTQPVNLTRVDVVGDKADLLSNTLLESLLEPLLSSSDKTVDQLLKETNSTVNNLKYSGLFSSVQAKLDQSKSGEVLDVLGDKVLDVGAQLDVQLNKLGGFAIQSVHNNLGNAINIALDNKNVFDNGESLKALAVLNKMEGLNSQLVDFQYKMPMLNPSTKLVVEGLYQDSKLSIFDSKQKTVGIKLGLEKQKYCAKSGMFSTITSGVGYHKRDVSDIKDNASDEIKAYAGDDIKQSFFLNGLSTNMEYIPKSTVLPLNGLTFKLDNELAGLLANEDQDKFYKVNLGAQLAKSTPGKWLTLTSGFELGHIVNLTNNGPIHFQDKFYPTIPGDILPLQPRGSLGALSYAGYSLGLLSKLGFVSVDCPLRAYGELKGAVVTSQGLSALTADKLQNGVDVGVVYQSGSAAARVFSRTKLGHSPMFGFEVSVDGDW